MNFKYYFFALAMTCATVLTSCEKKSASSTSEEPTPSARIVAKPDSVYKYKISADGTETLDQKAYYTYDAVRNLICKFDTILGYNRPCVKSKVEMEYNAKGLMTEKREYYFYKGHDRWTNEFCRQYSYDSLNRLSVYYVYEFFTEPVTGQPGQKIVYSWMDDRHAESIQYNYMGSWVPSFRTEYTYNERGDVEKYVIYGLSWADPSIERYMFTDECTFDQYGNLVSFERRDPDDVLMNSDYYKYDYDADGKILVKWYSSDRDGEKRTYTEKYVYYY
ncbi:MAG: hypothetical protein IJQ18_06905 [Paludibacteraceae bacterium]|nr:hypothetical protein [Paludibacteraceae bacterium]